MSAKVVEVVLTRALNDPGFAESIFTNVEDALASYDLTKQELEDFKSLTRESLDELARSLPEERISMAWPPKGVGP